MNAGEQIATTTGRCPSIITMGSEGWVKTISFANDWFNAAPRISVGGTIAAAGLLAIRNDTPDPTTASAASGLVAYQGSPLLGQIGEGWLLVQMLAEDRIKVEYLKGATQQPAAFTNAAQEYVR